VSKFPLLLSAVVLVLATGVAWATNAGECAGNTHFLIGTGVYDITGPAVGLGLIGYAWPGQFGEGIHTRLRARAFIVASPCNGRRAVFVSADLGLLAQSVERGVAAALRQRYGDLYREENVLLSATHTHSGPGGYAHYFLYNASIFGFDEQSYRAVVDGIVAAIGRAHEDLAPGRIKIAVGDLLGASINRSPPAYVQNPAAERARWKYDTDKRMTVLRFERDNGDQIGVIAWFGVHGTSMGNQNHYVSADNKGYASLLFERREHTDYASPHTFVAAFAQGAEGDVTPNINGGTDGGGRDDFEDTEISGGKQFRRAWELYQGATELLRGGVDYRHQYVKMDAVDVAPRWTDGVPRHTCAAAIGLSMLAGAEDGPGIGWEGFTCRGATGWEAVVCWLRANDCQGEKPVALTMGLKWRTPLTPEVLPVQIVTLGDLALMAVPGEPTTMSGRRFEDTVLQELRPAGVTRAVTAGLSNAYAGYVATREEYAAQNYEGASTHFGPWTQAAYQQEFQRLAAALREGRELPTGPQPRDLSGEQLSLQIGVIYDGHPWDEPFGAVAEDAKPSYRRSDVVRVKFWGGHLKNDLRIQDSYLRVERKEGDRWSPVAYDWDWETKLHWQRRYCLPSLRCSLITAEWDIPPDQPPGTYRIRHDGAALPIGSEQPQAYEGVSRPFAVE
jgi:neutral ceramidase